MIMNLVSVVAKLPEVQNNFDGKFLPWGAMCGTQCDTCHRKTAILALRASSCERPG